MAIYRNIHLTFWEDSKIYDDFTPEDKYFLLWLLTNPKTNIIGCYEISFKKAQSELGYTKDVIEMLINRLSNDHQTIDYNKETREILIKNWYKYNWTKSEKLDKPIITAINNIKCLEFRDSLINIYNKQERTIPYRYPIDTTDTVTDCITDSVLVIINYLNEILKTNYKTSTDKTIKSIRARLKDGFTIDDFKIVIDKKYKEWLGTEHQKYLRPETLFGTKFESYLNQIDTPTKQQNNKQGMILATDIDWEENND